jgi:hypothetical protein
MTRSIAVVLMFAASMTVGTPCTADAQLGGLIKKKVKEAIKPPEKPSEPAPAPAGQSSNAAEEESGSSGLPSIAGGVLVISPETIARVIRGLDSEAAMLADFHKVLAKYPTREQYEQCKHQVMLGPEGQKIAMGMVNLPQNATPEQTQAVITKLNLEVEALQKKRCPLDPNDWNDSKRSERVKQIHEKAASLARPKPAPSTALKFVVNPFDALPDTVSADTVLVITGGGLSEREYSILIERLVKYCEARKLMDMSPDKGDVKIPGAGQDLYWIYKKEELAALKQFDCNAFLKKYASVYGADAG